MSRTDRDMTRWRWNQHFKLTDGVSEHGGYVWDRGCPCYGEPDAWKWRSWYSPHEWVCRRDGSAISVAGNAPPTAIR